MITVKLPNGVTAQFPDGMASQDIERVLQQQFGGAAAPAPAAEPVAASEVPGQFDVPLDLPLPGSFDPVANDGHQYERALEQSYGKMGLIDRAGTVAENALQGIPALGPAIQKGGDFVMSETLGRLQGYDPAVTRQALEDNRSVRATLAPNEAMAGNVAGMLATTKKLSDMPGGKRLLGMEGSLPSRALFSGASGAVMSGADSLVRNNGDLQKTVGDTLIGGGVSAAIPVLGAGIKAGATPFVNRTASAIRGAVNPVAEAGQRVAQAFSKGPGISAADEAAARMNGQQLLNVDRGNETVRALARSAANQNPEARNMLENVTQERFKGQSGRVVNFFRRITGGNVDDLARKAQIDAQARAAVTPAYTKAMNDPNARAVWNKPIQELMQSDVFRAAINEAESTGTNKAAIHGGKAVRNPFQFREDGSVTLRVNPDGSRALPSLQFWDQVKKNLDGRIGVAKRSGDDALASDLMAIKQKLVSTLDTAVPSYKQARGTAALFFDAEDAVDAGRKAWSAPKDIDESLAAINGMTAAEKKDFGLGLVSQIMDDVRATNNGTSATRLFDSDARKALVEAALGAPKARELEAFIRVEDIMNKVRGSVTGNSTTARQLMEMGLVGGGAGLYTGDFQTGFTVAALVGAGRVAANTIGKKVDERVLENIAKLLISGSKADLDHAIANAQMSPKHLAAIEAIQRGIAITARTSVMAGVAAQ